jgi:hypothetical protein
MTDIEQILVEKLLASSAPWTNKGGGQQHYEASW